MRGRIEDDMKMKNYIYNSLKKEPLILRQYIDSMADSSWATKKNYLNVISMYFRWLIRNEKMTEINVENLNQLLPMDINAYMGQLKYVEDKDGNVRECSSSKQTLTWSGLNSFFEFMYVNGLIKENVVAKTKRPKNKDVPSNKYLSQKQMKELVKKLENPKGLKDIRKQTLECDSLIIRMFLSTGMRVSALREIDIEDIDFENRIVTTINKGNKTKDYKLIDPVINAIEKWLDKRAILMKQPRDKQTGPLFVSLRASRVSYTYVYNTVKFYTSLIGIEEGYSCHKLRHSYGTAVYMFTKDINYTKEAMGHENVTTTQRYINEIDDKLDNIVSDKLSSLVG